MYNIVEYKLYQKLYLLYNQTKDGVKMGDKMNNLFDFATSELSQDAILCWCINWFNVNDKYMKKMSKEVIKLLMDVDIEKEENIYIYQQISKSDILLYFPINKIAWIIEDKVYTSEHGKQINRYKKAIQALNDNKKRELHLGDSYDIKTTFFKTGFFYDDDKIVEADKLVKGIELYEILEKYREFSIILDMYCEYFKKWYIDWYDQHKNYQDISQANHWEWNISQYTIAQYTFIRKIFDESRWKGKEGSKNNLSEEEKDLFKVYHGSNVGGRPWTEINIFSDEIRTDYYHIFWRVDTEKRGPYISLRFYDNYNTKDEKQKQEHIEKYRFHREQVKQICDENPTLLWKWEDVKTRKTENYKESAIMTIYLDEILKNWNEKSKEFIKKINFLTDKFIEMN